MSGIEIAGVLLGTFPLIISGIEHWHNVAKVGGYLWKVRKECTKCRTDVNFHEILYKRNLKELLLPIVAEADDVALLVRDPGGQGWKDQALQDRLKGRLDESYEVYMDIITRMNETAEELRRELSLDKPAVQDKLALPDTKKQRLPFPSKSSKSMISKSNFDYQMFRLKFSLREAVREELFTHLKECNERLAKLLTTSDRVSALENSSPSTNKQMSALEKAFSNAWRTSDRLFKALQNAWNCSCQPYHYANLRLEHRKLPETCFEVILMFMCPADHRSIPWSWKELRCGRMDTCLAHSPMPNKAPPQQPPNGHTSVSVSSQKIKKVNFNTTAPVPKIEVDLLSSPTIQLCKLLGDPECSGCMGVIGHEDDMYHLHPFSKRIHHGEESALTLDYILSPQFEGILSRRQRYSIALLLASSVAQLQFTPWLRTSLTKEDVLFFPGPDNDIPFGEPFIRQGFSSDTSSSSSEVNECNFFSLGILLLELCFGKRLEDHPLRQKYPSDDAKFKHEFDLMAAVKWSNSVCDEGGEDYAASVKWCLTGAGNMGKGWRVEMIKKVIRPLEMCQEHFKTASV